MIVLSIAEELIIGEGGYGLYLRLPQHHILRVVLKGFYAILLFLMGYYGLKSLATKWIIYLWFLCYILGFIIASIRTFINIEFPAAFGFNFWNFCISFYILLLNPFPYLFLLMLHFLFRQTMRKI